MDLDPAVPVPARGRALLPSRGAVMKDETKPAGSPAAEEAFSAIAAAAELEASLAAGAETHDPDRQVAELEAELAEVGALVEEKQAALAEAEARAERAQAEISRAGERLRRDAERGAERKIRELLLAQLELLDDLDRTLEAARAAGAAPAADAGTRLLEGVELVRRRFVGALERWGVRPQVALGERFDPTLHEAVSAQPAPPERAGTIVAVVREGYLLGEDPLRPARVVVGKA